MAVEKVRLKTLILVKFAVEVLAGLGFALFAGTLFVFLLGAPLPAAGLYAFRMFGVAIFAMGIACWLTRDEPESTAARALITAMLLYDLAFVAILLAARFSAGLSGVGFWPTVAVHLGLAACSLLCLRKEPAVARAG